MSWSAAIGVFVASLVLGGKVKRSFKNIGAAVVAGILSGIVLWLLS